MFECVCLYIYDVVLPFIWFFSLLVVLSYSDLAALFYYYILDAY